MRRSRSDAPGGAGEATTRASGSSGKSDVVIVVGAACCGGAPAGGVSEVQHRCQVILCGLQTQLKASSSVLCYLGGDKSHERMCRQCC